MIPNQKGIFLHPPILLVSNVTQTTANLVWTPSSYGRSKKFLVWTPSSNGAASVAFCYKIRYWRNGQRSSVHVFVDSGENQFRLEDLQPGSTYSINIVATSEDGQESAPSDDIEFTTLQAHQNMSTSVGIAPCIRSTIVDELKLLKELISNLSKKSDEAKLAIIETGCPLNGSVSEIRRASETCTGRSGFSQVMSTRFALDVSQSINVAGPTLISVQSVTETSPKKRTRRGERGGKKKIVLLPPPKLELDLITQTTAELTWMPSPSCDASVAFFYIIRCWPKGQRLPVLIGVDSGETRFRLKNLQPGTTYSINIVAASENGQESAPSDAIGFTTLLTPIGVAQLYSTAVGKFMLLGKMVSHFTDELNGSIITEKKASDVIESENLLGEKTKGSCLTKSLHDADGPNLQFNKEFKIGGTSVESKEKWTEISEVIDRLKTIALRPLLQAEAKIEMETKWFDTIESTNPSVKAIEDLFLNGVSVNTEDNNGQTALHYLCRKKKSENLANLVRLLVANGVNVNAKSYEGKTALHLLCQYNEDNESLINVVQLLIENGVDINAKDNVGQTALQLLCQNNSNETLIVVIRLLVENRVDAEAKDITGRTALHFLFQNDKSKNLIYIVRLLVANGVDVNAKDKYGWTALHYLCELNKNENLIDIVRFLINYGVFVNATDNNGRTALHFLLKSYHNNNLVNIVRLLIENGIDVNTKNYEGKTALHLLFQYNENRNLIDVVRLLVENGVDANAKDNHGQTALHFLCLRNNSKNLTGVVRLFVEKGIKVDVKDNYACETMDLIGQYFQK